MALYNYRFQMKYTGTNAFMRALITRVHSHEDPLDVEIQDSQFAAFRILASDVEVTFENITRRPVVADEPVP